MKLSVSDIAAIHSAAARNKSKKFRKQMTASQICAAEGGQWQNGACVYSNNPKYKL